MKTIYLLRHGALAETLRGCFVGQIDPPLAPAGRRQAAELGRVLRALRVEAIHCSDLARSRQSAALIAADSGIRIEAHRALREIALGDWEGLSRRAVAARFPEAYAARGADIVNYRVPGGESFADCRRRVLDAWRAIVARDAERIVVVGHAGANRALLCELLGRPAAGLLAIDQDYACVNIVSAHAGCDTVLAINLGAAQLAAADAASRCGPPPVPPSAQPPRRTP